MSERKGQKLYNSIVEKLKKKQDSTLVIDVDFDAKVCNELFYMSDTEFSQLTESRKCN
jgi:hypothetical protein